MGLVSLIEDIQEHHDEHWHKITKKDQANYQMTPRQKIIKEYDQQLRHNPEIILKKALSRYRSQRFPRKLKDRIPTEQIMQIIKLRPRM